MFTVELLEFMVTHFSCYLWVVLTNEFTSSMKTSLIKDQVFLLKLKTNPSTKEHLHK